MRATLEGGSRDDDAELILSRNTASMLRAWGKLPPALRVFKVEPETTHDLEVWRSGLQKSFLMANHCTARLWR